MSAPVIAVVPTSSSVPAEVVTASLAVGFTDAGMPAALVALAGGAAVQRLTGAGVDAATGAGRLPVVVQAAGVAAVARREGVSLVVLHAPVGLLAPLDASGATLRDLLVSLGALDIRAGVVLATSADGDTLSHCTLTTEALGARGVDVLGIAVVGHDGPWPDAARLEDLTGAPLLGTTPPDAETWDGEQFTARAGAWLPLE